MTPEPLTPRASAQPNLKRFEPIKVVIFALSATTLALACLLLPALWYSATSSGDRISDTASRERTEAFLLTPPLHLTPVASNQASPAINSMHLNPRDNDTLTNQIVGKQKFSGLPVSQDKNLRLSWITVWDTDAQDGDAIRIESQGYSRTITLTKSPATFAIPIPDAGSVRITGIRDGEGGGITAGISSSGIQIIFPVMSIGQVLNLKVIS